jgi:hypothetical protein
MSEIQNRLAEIKTRLAKATEGEWVYDSKRDTHDCCIYVKGLEPTVEYIGDYSYTPNLDLSNGGIVGSSEWTWIKDNDGEFIANAKQDIEFLLAEIDRLKQLIQEQS